jgi:hypothetical protein
MLSSATSDLFSITKFRRQRLSAPSMLLSSTRTFSFAANAQSGTRTGRIASARNRPCMCHPPVSPMLLAPAGVIDRVIRTGQAVPPAGAQDWNHSELGAFAAKRGPTRAVRSQVEDACGREAVTDSASASGSVTGSEQTSPAQTKAALSVAALIFSWAGCDVGSVDEARSTMRSR